MKLAVIDASFAGSWIIPDESNATAARILHEILHRAIEMAVPSLWTYEMCNLIQSALRRQRMEEADAS